MLRIQKLNRPNKKSGDHLEQGKTFKKKGIQITNISAGSKIYVDPFVSPVVKKKKKKKKK